jgi:hypothetical protein
VKKERNTDAGVNISTGFDIGLCRHVELAVASESTMRRRDNLPASMLITLKRTFSTLWTGDHRSEESSYCIGSSPGVWRMEMHTSPFA